MINKQASSDNYDFVQNHFTDTMRTSEVFSFEGTDKPNPQLSAEVRLMRNIFSIFKKEDMQTQILYKTLEQIKRTAYDYIYIEGLLNDDSKIISEMYQRFLPRIEVFIGKNSGNQTDAKDIFQAALLVILKNIKRADFELDSKFYVYLFGICRFKWMNELSGSGRHPLPIEEMDEVFDEPLVIQMLLQEELQQLCDEKLRELPARGQQLLTLFWAGHRFKEIAEIMSYASAASARKEKCKHQKQLIEKIQKDIRYEELRLDR